MKLLVMRLHSRMFKTVLPNFLLLSCSIILALGTSELILRAFFPKYSYASESNYALDSLLTWRTGPNSRLIRKHPDTNKKHPVFYNNHGMRQHRNITQKEINSSVVISILGDSYTENARLPTQYGFTEILDYLLNSESDQENYLVLNYGVSGYGTDQAFITYQSSPLAKHSAHVFYVLCENDLGDIYNNNLFTFHDDEFYINGITRLVQLPAKNPSKAKAFLRNFYLTYLILDAISGFEAYSKPITESYTFDTNQLRKNQKTREESSIAKQITDNIWANKFDKAAGSMGIMNAILDQLRLEVEKNGGVFHIVILPISYPFHI